jgi:hypothetical protein
VDTAVLAKKFLVTETDLNDIGFLTEFDRLCPAPSFVPNPSGLLVSVSDPPLASACTLTSPSGDLENSRMRSAASVTGGCTPSSPCPDDFNPFMSLVKLEGEVANATTASTGIGEEDVARSPMDGGAPIDCADFTTSWASCSAITESADVSLRPASELQRYTPVETLEQSRWLRLQLHNFRVRGRVWGNQGAERGCDRGSRSGRRMAGSCREMRARRKGPENEGIDGELEGSLDTARRWKRLTLGEMMRRSRVASSVDAGLALIGCRGQTVTASQCPNPDRRQMRPSGGH